MLPITDSIVDKFVKEAERFPVLSREEELKVAKKAARGNRKAKQALAEHNLRFVIKVAHQYRGYRFPLADLIQAGNEGMMHAIHKFDHKRGYRFITYAVAWIRAYINNYLLANWSAVRFGTTQAQRTLFFKLRKQRMELEYKLQREITIEDLVEHFHLKKKEVEDCVKRMAGRDSSIDAPLGTEGRETHKDLMVSHLPTPAEEVLSEERAKMVREGVQKLMFTLNRKQQDILSYRLLADEPQTLSQLGKRHGISRERVRQIEEGVIKKLRAQLREIVS